MFKQKILPALFYSLIVAAVLILDAKIFLSGRNTLGFGLLILLSLFCFVYAWRGAYVYRYLFPSLFAFGAFVVLPLAYTIYISFTNYSGTNLQTLRDVQYLIGRESDTDLSRPCSFKLYREDGEAGLKYSIVLTGKTQGDTNAVESSYRAEGFQPALNSGDQGQLLPSRAVEPAELPAGKPLGMADVIKVRDALKKITLELPDKSELKLISLTSFAPRVPVWALDPGDGSFKNKDGAVLKPDFVSGFYRNTQTGEKHGPGFRVSIGWENYKRIFTDSAIRQPFIAVFIWTVIFALASVLLTFSVGFLLAVLLEWKALRGRKLLRTLLILPYSVPAFISILIFKGLFNPQFGEINAILGAVFGLSPEWTTNPTLAKVMILIVNLWLGYPYMMILGTGILQSIPSDIYEASSIDGGNAFSDVFKITLPLILPPLKPLLIASFAFNFNNFLLIQLLTAGAPPILGAATSVGHTDILVTYTFNLAFRGGAGGGNYFGFAGAIATIIFLIVSVLSYLNFKAATRGDQWRY